MSPITCALGLSSRPVPHKNPIKPATASTLSTHSNETNETSFFITQFLSIGRTTPAHGQLGPQFIHQGGLFAILLGLPTRQLLFLQLLDHFPVPRGRQKFRARPV